MKSTIISIMLVLIIFLSGCTELDSIFGGNVIKVEEPVTEEGFRDVLVINDIQINPSSPLVPDVDVILSFVVENMDEEKEAKNVKVELFDAPKFKNEGGELCNSADGLCQPDRCSESDPCKSILPGEQKLISFVLKAPNENDIAMLKTEVELQFRVEYEFDGSLLYRTMVIDMEEIKSRQRAGESVSLEIPKFLGSGPVQIDVELMGAPYILAGYSGTFLFTVKKVGDPANGMLNGSKISRGGLEIIFPSDLGTVEPRSKFTCDENVCTNSEDIELYKGESPTLYFKVKEIPDINVPFKSFEITAKVKYIYELRDSIKVTIEPYV